MRRRRTGDQRTTPTPAEQLDAARSRIVELETKLGQVREQLTAARADAAAARSDRDRHRRKVIAHADRAIRSRVGRIVSTRDRLAEVTAELTAARSRPGGQGDIDEAARRIVELQRRLAEAHDRADKVTADRDELAGRYDRLTAQATAAADRLRAMTADRSHMATVLGQWDTLAGRLARTGQTQQLSPADRQIVATWAAWKKKTTAQTGDRTPAGQPPKKG